MDAHTAVTHRTDVKPPEVPIQSEPPVAHNGTYGRLIGLSGLVGVFDGLHLVELGCWLLPWGDVLDNIPVKAIDETQDRCNEAKTLATSASSYSHLRSHHNLEPMRRRSSVIEGCPSIVTGLTQVDPRHHAQASCGDACLSSLCSRLTARACKSAWSAARRSTAVVSPFLSAS